MPIEGETLSGSHAGLFGPNRLGDTFGRRVLFQQTGEYSEQSPRAGTDQVFGRVQIDADGVFIVVLRDVVGRILRCAASEPDRR